jgi:pimeloyl-ACP methyl ester carboxylesterase
MSEMYRLPDGRVLACSDIGPRDAADVLLCLPGLLETRQTFAPVLQAAQPQALRVISVDHCGRGDSAPLTGDQGYTMARYLEDVTQVLQHHVLPQGAQRVHVLGTSMGGILGMYLAANAALPIRTLILNDVGLSFYWVSIYGLYDGMKKGMSSLLPEDIAAQLNVTLGAMRAVQSPSHFDLPYRRDWKGMKFGHLLQHYSGGVRLVYGAESGVCLADQVRELRGQFPHARVLEVAGAKHPAPFTPEVCAFVLADLAPPIPVTQPTQLPLIDASESQVTNVTASVTPSDSPAVDASQSLGSPIASPKARAMTEEGLWAWVKRKLGGRG